jgi:hypothetical protein
MSTTYRKREETILYKRPMFRSQQFPLPGMADFGVCQNQCLPAGQIDGLSQLLRFKFGSGSGHWLVADVAVSVRVKPAGDLVVAYLLR